MDTAHRSLLARPSRPIPTVYQTCHRRFQQWVRSGVFKQVLEALATDLKERGRLDLSECYIDGTFIVAKKGGSTLERPSAGRVRSSWQWQTALAFLSPYTLHLLRRMGSLAEATVVQCFVSLMRIPARLIGDRAYDSDPLDHHLAVEHGIEMIAPHRYNRRTSSTQDGRVLRRYKHRWKIESGCLHGCRISAGYRCATTIIRRISWALSSLVA